MTGLPSNPRQAPRLPKYRAQNAPMPGGVWLPTHRRNADRIGLRGTFFSTRDLWGKDMTTRDDFLQHLWTDVINPLLRDAALDNIIAHCQRNPAGPFGNTGPAIERMLAAGIARPDLSLVLRSVAYEAVFGTLYALSEPGLDSDDDASTLYEELLMADPSGKEGRPGSEDAARQ